MTYEELPEDLRAKLEESKYSAVRYSSSAEKSADTVDDAVLIDKMIPLKVLMEKHKGYVVHSVPKVWYDFVSRPYREADPPNAEKCVQLVTEALQSVE